MLLECRWTSPTQRVNGCKGGNRSWVGGRYNFDLIRFKRIPHFPVLMHNDCCYQDAWSQLDFSSDHELPTFHVLFSGRNISCHCTIKMPRTLTLENPKHPNNSKIIHLPRTQLECNFVKTEIWKLLAPEQHLNNIAVLNITNTNMSHLRFFVVITGNPSKTRHSLSTPSFLTRADLQCGKNHNAIVTDNGARHARE